MINGETPFRIAVGVLLMLFLGIRWYFQLRVLPVQSARKHHSRRERILYLLQGLGSIALIYPVSSLLDGFHAPLPTAIRGVGVLLGVVGLAL